MAEKRWLIGRVVAAYEIGRRDAQAGRRSKRSPADDDAEWEYRSLGRRDELRRMARDRRLAQSEMELDGVAPVPEPRPRARVRGLVTLPRRRPRRTAPVAVNGDLFD